MGRTLAVVAVGLLAGAGQARAEGIDAQRFAPSTGAAGGFMVERAGLAEHLGVGAGLFLHFADDPIVETDTMTGDTLSRPLDTAIAADLLASIGLFGRAEVGIHLPIELVYDGDGLVAGGGRLSPSGGIGDLRVVPKAILWRGGGRTALAVGAALPVTFPTGDGTALRGADGMSVEPRLLLGLLAARWGVHLNVGYRLRGDPPSGLVGGDEVTLGASATFAVSRRRDVLDLHAELVGGVLLSGDGPGAVAMPLEALAGLIWKPHSDWSVHAGAGPGLTNGLGEPDVRVLVGIRWSPRRADTAIRDRDGDGLADLHDKCPDQAEDEDGFEDSDGCAEADNDGDGVLDDVDECPAIAEEKGGDGDGCPDRARVVFVDGKLIVFGKVQFETGSASIKKNSQQLLDEMAGVLKEYPDLKLVRIEGHTDDVGEAPDNQRLSEERAESVKRALVERGVEGGRLQTRGYGESKPIGPNRTRAGRANNRRVEFIKID